MMRLLSPVMNTYAGICAGLSFISRVVGLLLLTLYKWRYGFNRPSLKSKHLHLHQSQSANLTLILMDDLTGLRIRPTDRLKVLHLIDYETYNILMDRWFISSAKAFKSSQCTQWISHAEMWGPGFDRWIDTDTIAANVERR